ncbi:MAG: DUF2138 family protein [Elusimicrobiota bacterium]
MNKNKLEIAAWICVLVLALAGVYFILLRFEPGGPGPVPTAPATSAGVSVDILSAPELPPSRIDIDMPDVVVLTSSLSRLPARLLSHPVLGGLLDEDLVFYYEDSEGRLGLSGALRRIAYEHELSSLDGVLSYVFNTPAKVALWKGRDGRLKSYMMVLRSEGLRGAVEAAAKIVAEDSQLRLVGRKEWGGEPLSVYELRYGRHHKAYFTPAGKELFVYSEPGMALPGRGFLEKWAPRFGREFFKRRRRGFFSRLFGSHKEEDKHAVVLSLRFLSFGYQKYFPSVESLRLEYREKEWRTFLLSGGTPVGRSYDAAGVWKALPTGPSLCAALPVEPAALTGIAGSLLEGGKPAAEALLGAVEPPVAICWYPESKLHTPLVAAKFKRGPEHNAVLKALFEKTVGVREARRALDNDADPYGLLKVAEEAGDGGIVWTRDVSSPYGLLETAGHRKGGFMRSRRYFRVGLANWGGYLLFSPDHALVHKAVSVLEKRFPPVTDSFLSGEEANSLVIYPKSLSLLVKESVLESLPSSQESIFRESVSRHLYPLLDKFSGSQAMALSMPSLSPESAGRWQELKWRAIVSR